MICLDTDLFLSTLLETHVFFPFQETLSHYLFKQSLLFFLSFQTSNRKSCIFSLYLLYLPCLLTYLPSLSPTPNVSDDVLNSLTYFSISLCLCLDNCITYKANIFFHSTSSLKKNPHFSAPCNRLTFISKSFVHKAHNTE